MKIKSRAKSQIDVNNLEQWRVIYSHYREQQENDRSFAITGTAIADAQLIRTIRWAMVGEISEGNKDDVFEYRHALGTMSDRIELAAAIGLIDLTTKDNLNNVRKIRNEYAHGLCYVNENDGSSLPVSFDSPTIVSLCTSLTIQTDMSKSSDSRDRFFWAIHEVFADLSRVHRHPKPPSWHHLTRGRKKG